MTRPQPEASMFAKLSRKRPADLHPLLVETHETWLRGGMPISDAATQLDVRANTVYGWLIGRGRPLLSQLDAMMGLIGYHYSIVNGSRTDRRLPASEFSSRSNRADLADGVHPLLAEVDDMVRDSRVVLADFAGEMGVSTSYLSNWFSNKADPAILDVDRLVGLIGRGHRLAVTRGLRRTQRQAGNETA